MLYWFAMLIDAERITEHVRAVERKADALDVASGFHDPQRLQRGLQDALAELDRPARTAFTQDQLIAYALEEQRKAKGLVS